MSEKIRNRRTVIAAGVLSLALVAPATNVPVIQDLALPVAYAATGASTFNERYETENFWEKDEAKIIDLALDAGDKVEPTTKTIFNWTFRNDNGELVLIRPKSNTAYKTGEVDIPVKVTPAGGASFNTTLKVTVIDEADTTWVEELPNFAVRQPVDFSNGLIQDIPGLTVPKDATVEKDGIAPLSWKVRNNDGVLQVEAPTTFSGSAPENKDIPITISEGGHTEKATLRLKATPPEKSAAGGTAGTVGGALLPILGGIIGLIPGAGPLGNALGSLGNLIGGGNNGGTGGNNGGTGGNNGGTGGNNGGTGGNTGGRGGIFDGMFRDAVKIEIKDNGSHNASNNTGIAPSAVAPSAVVVSDNASNNGSNNTGVAPSAVVVSDNTGVAPSAVVVTDNASNNGSNNTGVAPSAVNVSDNGSNNTGVAPSAVNVSDNGSNNTGVAPSAVNVSNNTGVAPSAVNVSDNTGVAPSAVVVSDNGSNNTGVAPSAVNVSNNTGVAPSAVNVSNNTGVAPSAVVVSENGSNNGNNNTGIAPSGVIGVQQGAVNISDNGSNNASNNTGIDKRRGEGKAPAADGKSKISDPRCIASLVGFGLPAAVLIPVLLANVFRIPGFEGIQDSMKAAAASIGAPLNIPQEQVAAGVGGFAGAFAIAGLIGTITQCIPSKAEREAAKGDKPSSTETTAPTTTESLTPSPKPSGSSNKAPKTNEPAPAAK